MPANTGKAGAIHRGACFAGKPAPTGPESHLRSHGTCGSGFTREEALKVNHGCRLNQTKPKRPTDTRHRLPPNQLLSLRVQEDRVNLLSLCRSLIHWSRHTT